MMTTFGVFLPARAASATSGQAIRATMVSRIERRHMIWPSGQKRFVTGAILLRPRSGHKRRRHDRMMSSMHSSPADWQLPPGVDRGLWSYLHDEALAQRYDAELADCALLTVDRLFAERHFVQPGRLIDLGCGTGRLLLRFAA